MGRCECGDPVCPVCFPGAAENEILVDDVINKLDGLTDEQLRAFLFLVSREVDLRGEQRSGSTNSLAESCRDCGPGCRCGDDCECIDDPLDLDPDVEPLEDNGIRLMVNISGRDGRIIDVLGPFDHSGNAESAGWDYTKRTELSFEVCDLENKKCGCVSSKIPVLDETAKMEAACDFLPKVAAALGADFTVCSTKPERLCYPLDGWKPVAHWWEHPAGARVWQEYIQEHGQNVQRWFSRSPGGGVEQKHGPFVDVTDAVDAATVVGG